MSNAQPGSPRRRLRSSRKVKVDGVSSSDASISADPAPQSRSHSPAEVTSLRPRRRSVRKRPLQEDQTSRKRRMPAPLDPDGKLPTLREMLEGEGEGEGEDADASTRRKPKRLKATRGFEGPAPSRPRTKPMLPPQSSDQDEDEDEDGFVDPVALEVLNRFSRPRQHFTSALKGRPTVLIPSSRAKKRRSESASEAQRRSPFLLKNKNKFLAARPRVPKRRLPRHPTAAEPAQGLDRLSPDLSCDIQGSSPLVHLVSSPDHPPDRQMQGLDQGLPAVLDESSDYTGGDDLRDDYSVPSSSPRDANPGVNACAASVPAADDPIEEVAESDIDEWGGGDRRNRRDARDEGDADFSAKLGEFADESPIKNIKKVRSKAKRKVLTPRKRLRPVAPATPVMNIDDIDAIDLPRRRHSTTRWDEFGLHPVPRGHTHPGMASRSASVSAIGPRGSVSIPVAEISSASLPPMRHLLELDGQEASATQLLEAFASNVLPTTLVSKLGRRLWMYMCILKKDMERAPGASNLEDQAKWLESKRSDHKQYNLSVDKIITQIVAPGHDEVGGVPSTNELAHCLVPVLFLALWTAFNLGGAVEGDEAVVGPSQYCRFTATTLRLVSKIAGWIMDLEAVVRRDVDTIVGGTPWVLTRLDGRAFRSYIGAFSKSLQEPMAWLDDEHDAWRTYQEKQRLSEAAAQEARAVERLRNLELLKREDARRAAEEKAKNEVLAEKRRRYTEMCQSTYEMRKLELEREAARRALWNPVPGRVSPASSTPVTAVVQTRQLTSVATVSQGSITTASAPHGRTTAAGASSDRLVSLPQQPRHLRSSPSSSLPLPATQPTSRGLVLPTGPGATRPSIPSKPASQASAYPAAGPPATQFHPRRNLPLSLVNVWKDRPVASLSIPPPQQAMSTKGDESARQPSQPRRPDLAVTQEGLSIPGQAEKVSNITAVSSSMDTSGFEWTAEDTEWLATELQECGGKPQASEIKGWAEILECSVEDVEAKIKELA